MHGGECGEVCWSVGRGKGRGMGGVGKIRGDGWCEEVWGAGVGECMR